MFSKHRGTMSFTATSMIAGNASCQRCVIGFCSVKVACIGLSQFVALAPFKPAPLSHNTLELLFATLLRRSIVFLSPGKPVGGQHRTIASRPATSLALQIADSLCSSLLPFRIQTAVCTPIVGVDSSLLQEARDINGAVALQFYGGR